MKTNVKAGRPEMSPNEKKVRVVVYLPRVLAMLWPSKRIVEMIEGYGNEPAPVTKEDKPVSRVQELASKFGLKTGATINEPLKPFGDVEDYNIPVTSSSVANALLRRFAAILKESTPEGMKVISSQLGEWENMGQ